MEYSVFLTTFLIPEALLQRRFLEYFVKCRCSPIASFNRLRNRDTRLMLLSQGQCQDQDINILILSVLSSTPLNFFLMNTDLWTWTEGLCRYPFRKSESSGWNVTSDINDVFNPHKIYTKYYVKFWIWPIIGVFK